MKPDPGRFEHCAREVFQPVLAAKVVAATAKIKPAHMAQWGGVARTEIAFDFKKLPPHLLSAPMGDLGLPEERGADGDRLGGQGRMRRRLRERGGPVGRNPFARTAVDDDPASPG